LDPYQEGLWVKVLVTFAVDAEFAPWRKLRTFRQETLNHEHCSGGVHVETAQIGDNTVYVYLTGMGMKPFGFPESKCFKQYGVDIGISSGLAGSLKETYPALTIVCPSRVGGLTDAAGIAVTKSVFQLAIQNKAIAIETLLTSNRIIDTHEEKMRLSKFADAVDMESRHIVESLLEEQIPVAVVRAISDGSVEDMPIDFEKCLTSSGRVRAIPLLKELARNPAKVPELIRFGRQSRAAAEKLVSFLDSFVQILKPELLPCGVEEKLVG
jgi:nucleoside phosphorylase